jgi:hypothetical protein
MNLAARDLISLERTFLGEERAHVTDEGFRDGDGQF